MTHAQLRLYEIISRRQPYCEYWPAINDWLDTGVPTSLALAVANRTVAAMRRRGLIDIDADGCFVLGRVAE